MVLPVLAITVLAAALQIGGTPPGGPLAKTFFESIGPTQSYLVPLMLVIGAFVGHSLRERSSGYAFSAGLVLEMAVVLGYALHTTLAGQPFNETFAVTLTQLISATAAVWAILWLDVPTTLRRDGKTARRSVMSTWPWSEGLMNFQIGIAIIANVVALGTALFILSLYPLSWQSWSVAAGRPLGWIALVLSLAALQLRGRLSPHAVGLSGMALIGLLACTIRGLQAYWRLDVDPVWGYRTLMLGWAAYAILVVAATWWIVSLR